MFTYKKCSEANEDAIFEAFQLGFSDYIIKLQLPKGGFFKHFFGPEGSNLEYSFIAFDDEQPVGLILGGIKVYEGVKTIRCGGFCIAPDYRGTEISSKLFNLHRNLALDNNCKQMLLEVIVGNDRAINFYKKKGYKKAYDLVYYCHNKLSEFNGDLPEGIIVKRIDIDALQNLRSKIKDIHINWQNDLDYVRKIEGQVHYGVYENTDMIGALSIHSSGRINFLWVDSKLRNKGIGRGLIENAVRELNLKKLNINFPNNYSLEKFVQTLNFTKDAISQYEMYISL